MCTTRIPLFITVWSFVVLVGGCAAESATCPPVGGDYQPLYTPLSGNCGQLANIFPVPFNGGTGGNNVDVKNLPNAKVSTEIVMKGCTVRMTQIVEKGNLVASKIDGDKISVRSENELTGMVSVTQFDDLGQAACYGTYDAQFTKNPMLVGGAASSSTGGPYNP
jgi:hypothetical protein